MYTTPTYTLNDHEVEVLKEAIEVIHGLANKLYPDTTDLDNRYANREIHEMTHSLGYFLLHYTAEKEKLPF